MVLLKKLLRIVFLLLTSPLMLSYLVLSLVANKDSLMASFSQFLSLVPGKIGVYCRAAFYSVLLNKCSSEIVVGFGTLISQQDVTLCSGCYIGPQSNIGKCMIGKNTLLGSAVHVLSGKGQHNFNELGTPIKDQGGVYSKVDIGENCWIGNAAVIMANIGTNSIIAAGSVVVNDVEPNSIYAGNPAKLIKYRS